MRLSWRRVLNRRASFELSGELAQLEVGIDRAERDVGYVQGVFDYLFTPQFLIRGTASVARADSDDERLVSYTRNLFRVELSYTFF